MMSKCVQMYVYMHMYIFTYLHIYTNTYIYIHIHTHIYTMIAHGIQQSNKQGFWHIYPSFVTLNFASAFDALNFNILLSSLELCNFSVETLK